MPFSNPVVGGKTLIREAIQSPDYTPGATGWTINRDGTVEFADGTFRGDITGATGTFSGTVSASNVTAGTFAATMGITGKIRTAAAGARVELDGAGLRAYDAAGANTVDIKSADGSATLQGTFATGKAGGTNTFMRMLDSGAGSELRTYNPPGTKFATMSSPLAGATGATPTVELKSGSDRMGITAIDGTARLLLAPDSIEMFVQRTSNSQPAGGGLILAPDVGAILAAYQLGGTGTQDGGEMRVTPSGFTLTNDVSSVNFDQIEGTSSGIGFHGRMTSNATAAISAAAGWSVAEQRVRQWGPMVFVHLALVRTGAAIPAGNVAEVVIASLGDGFPIQSTSLAAQWTAGVAAVHVTSAGDVVLRWVSGPLNTNDSFRIDGSYWTDPPA